MLGGALPQASRPLLVKEHELVKDALNVLIGVVSSTFPLSQVRTGVLAAQACTAQGRECEALAVSPSAGGVRPAGDYSDGLILALKTINLLTLFDKLNERKIFVAIGGTVETGPPCLCLSPAMSCARTGQTACRSTAAGRAAVL